MRAAFVATLLALVLAGCAGKAKIAAPAAALPPPAVSRPVASQPANISYGTILVERPVMTGAGNDGPGTMASPAAVGAAGSVSGGDVRSSILAAIGESWLGGRAGSVGEAGMPGGSAAEFIIRLDDGRTISVLQENAAKLEPGQRVMVIHGPETRLAPQAQS